MLWSLIIIACMGTDDGVACHEVKWHLIETRAECLRMRNEERGKIMDAKPLRVVARCEPGVFG
jgi:hypothetical protein